MFRSIRTAAPLLLAAALAACADSAPVTAPREAAGTFSPDLTAPRMPTWRLLSKSEAQRANISATAYVPSSDAVYALIGGGDFTAANLWKYDLATNRWSAIPTSNFPIGKYRKLIHDPATHSFLTYWDGLGQAYRVPEAGGAWTPIGSAPNSDAYYVGAAFIDPVSGHLRQLDGYGLFAMRDDIWELGTADGQWARVTQSATRPWPRIAPLLALDGSNARLYMTEGQGTYSGSQSDGVRLLDDVWRLDLATGSWTSVLPLSGSPDNVQGSGMAFVPPGVLLRFGGYIGGQKDQYGGTSDISSAQFLNGVIALDPGSATPAWHSVPTNGIAPVGRYSAGVYYDAVRNRLLVFGGVTKTGWVMDVWSLSF